MQKNRIFQTVEAFWLYLGETQSHFLRYIHATIAALIILQIIDSNFMHVHYLPERYLNIGTYFHISVGITITLVSFIFFYQVLSKRGPHYFFAYCFGDISQIKKDVLQLSNLKLPNAHPGGIAASIQGLGLLALFSVIVAGLAWLSAWTLHFSIAHTLQSLHKTLTGFIEVYIVGHGAMGLLHFILKQYAPQFLEETDQPT